MDQFNIFHRFFPRSGFAAGVAGDGGYADVKLLLYADLGKHVAFDGTVSWRKGIGRMICGMFPGTVFRYPCFRIALVFWFYLSIQGDSFANYWRSATDFGWL